jgi:hypothetical protein
MKDEGGGMRDESEKALTQLNAFSYSSLIPPPSSLLFSAPLCVSAVNA